MKTSDVWYMAYLVKKGHEIKTYEVVSHGKIKAEFDIDQKEWQKLKLEFSKSELSEFKLIIDRLKDLAF